MKKAFLILLITFSIALGGTHVLAQETPKATTDGSKGLVDASPSGYQLITPIGNLDKIEDQTPNGLSDYINLIIKIVIALAGAIAVVIIIINGIQYMGTDSVWSKSESKLKIGGAIGGIVLLLASYLILYTINPDLVNIKIGITKVSEKEWDYDALSESKIYRLGNLGNSQFKRTDYYDKIKAFVNNSKYSEYTDKLPHCIVQVAALRESGGNPSLVGHDEDAPLTGVPSRKTFVISGKKQSGETFTPNNNLITDRSFFNDDHKPGNIYSAKNPTADEYLGLDWRFSHGIGMFMITFYPEGSNKGPNYNKGTVTTITKKPVSIKDMFNADKAIEAGTELLQYNYKRCKQDVYKTFAAYQGGDCNDDSDTIRRESQIRKTMYDQCVAQDK